MCFGVMTWNVGNAAGIRPYAGQVVQEVRRLGRPELLLLQEVRSEDWLMQCARELEYPYFVRSASGRGGGTAILSDFPLESRSRIVFPASRFAGNAVLAVVRTPKGDVLAASVHFPAIPKGRSQDGTVLLSWKETGRILQNEVLDDTVRMQAAEMLLAELGKFDHQAVVFGGDLNTVALAKSLRKIYGAYRDALEGSPARFHGTYVKVEQGVRPRVDYLFHDNALIASDGLIGSATPGDHLPVFSRFCFVR